MQTMDLGKLFDNGLVFGICKELIQLKKIKKGNQFLKTKKISEDISQKNKVHKWPIKHMKSAPLFISKSAN